MKMRFVWLFFVLYSFSTFGQKQLPQSLTTEYRLYLSQITASEALLQLNKISEAREILNSTNNSLRGLEWSFLNKQLNQGQIFLQADSSQTYTAITYSPDGKRVAVGASNGKIVLFDGQSFVEQRRLVGHRAAVTTLTFSNDGKYLVSGGRDKQIIIWDMETHKANVSNNSLFTQGIYQVAYSADNKFIAVASWERLADRKPYIFGFVKVLEASTGKEIKHIELDNHPASCVRFTPNGELMIVATWGEIAYGFSTTDFQLKWQYDLSDPSEYNAFHSSDVSSDSKLVLLGSTDRRIHVLDAETGKKLSLIESWEGHTKIIKNISFSPSGNYFASGGEDQTIHIWDTKTFKKTASLIGHTETVLGLAWSKDESILLSASLDGTCQKWNLKKPFGVTAKVGSFGPWQTPTMKNGKYVGTPTSDKLMMIYETSTGKPYRLLGNQSGISADFNRSGSLMITGGFDGVVRVWDVDQGSELVTFSGHTSRVDGVAFVNETNSVVSIADTTIRIWDIKNKSVSNIYSLPAKGFRVVVSHDESKIIAGLSGGKVQILNRINGNLIKEIKLQEDIQEMAVSSGGKWLAIYAGKNITLVDMAKLTVVGSLIGHLKSGYGIGFSPDESYLISGSNDQTFKLWDLKRMQCTLTYHGFDEVIYNSKILSDTELFLSTSEGKIVYFDFTPLANHK